MKPLNQCAAHEDCPIPVNGIRKFCKWHKLADWRQYQHVARTVRDNIEFFRYLDDLDTMTSIEMISGDQYCNGKLVWEWPEKVRKRWHDYAPEDVAEPTEGYLPMDANNTVMVSGEGAHHWRETPETYRARMKKTAETLLGIYQIKRKEQVVESVSGLQPVDRYAEAVVV